MPERPYTMLSCCVSLDGYLGDRTPRLALSNAADFERVDAVRASSDAIMVGAATVRTDNPRLLVRSPERREARAARGRAALFAMTPLARYEVTGPGALTTVQQLVTKDVDRKVGAVTYALMLDDAGGVRSEKRSST